MRTPRPVPPFKTFNAAFFKIPGTMSIKTFLLLLSGAAWTIVYIDCIRIGFRDKTYAMPFWALAMNITWEILHAFSDVKVLGFDTQVVINIVWATFDLIILYTFFLFGKKYFPKNIRAASGFMPGEFRVS